MKRSVSKSKLFESEFVKEINSRTKATHCVLCGAKMTSPCNSHVVPQFVLKEIAENGKVSYGFDLSPIEINGLDKVTGIKNAYTFRLICNACDKKAFQDYESPSNIVNFSTLNSDLQKKILCEMAIKAHLSHLNLKYRLMAIKELSTGLSISEIENKGIVVPERLDEKEHKQYIQSLKKAIKTNKNPFLVLYNRILDYQTKLSTQTIISYSFDLKGNRIFDPYLICSTNNCRYFYLMIIPYRGKTYLMFYIEKNNIKNVEPIINQFNKLSEEEKLHFLFVSLIIHDEQFYMSPSFSYQIFKEDKKLVRLYKSTDGNMDTHYLIKDFREYKNYLLKDYCN